MNLSNIKRIAHVTITTALSLVLWLQPGMAQDQPPGPPQPDGPAQAAAEPVVLELDSAIELHANGDASARIVLGMTAEKYTQARRLMPDAKVFIRDMRPGRADWELAPESTCSYDDTTTSLLMKLHTAFRGFLIILCVPSCSLVFRLRSCTFP